MEKKEKNGFVTPPICIEVESTPIPDDDFLSGLFGSKSLMDASPMSGHTPAEANQELPEMDKDALRNAEHTGIFSRICPVSAMQHWNGKPAGDAGSEDPDVLMWYSREYKESDGDFRGDLDGGFREELDARFCEEPDNPPAVMPAEEPAPEPVFFGRDSIDGDGERIVHEENEQEVMEKPQESYRPPLPLDYTPNLSLALKDCVLEAELLKTLLQNINAVSEQNQSLIRQVEKLQQTVTKMEDAQLSNRIARSVQDTCSRLNQRATAIRSGLDNILDGLRSGAGDARTEMKKSTQQGLYAVHTMLDVSGKLNWLKECVDNGIFEIGKTIRRIGEIHARKEEIRTKKEELKAFRKGASEEKIKEMSSGGEAQPQDTFLQEYLRQLQTRLSNMSSLLQTAISRLAELDRDMMDKAYNAELEPELGVY